MGSPPIFMSDHFARSPPNLYRTDAILGEFYRAIIDQYNEKRVVLFLDSSCINLAPTFQNDVGNSVLAGSSNGTEIPHSRDTCRDDRTIEVWPCLKLRKKKSSLFPSITTASSLRFARIQKSRSELIPSCCVHEKRPVSPGRSVFAMIHAASDWSLKQVTRLSAMVPLPRRHVNLYFGVLFA